VAVKSGESLLNTLKLAFGDKVSSSEIKRVAGQGGVEVNGRRVTDSQEILENNSGDVIKFRKRDFIQIK